jgi:hypothetical protein
MTYLVCEGAHITTFEWDPAKSDHNTEERNLPFDLAMALFDGPTLELPDSRTDYGELRIRAIGKAYGLVLHCVYTDRDDTRRIISLRLANRRERDAYRAAFEN